MPIIDVMSMEIFFSRCSSSEPETCRQKEPVSAVSRDSFKNRGTNEKAVIFEKESMSEILSVLHEDKILCGMK